MRWWIPILLTGCTPIPDQVLLQGEIRDDLPEDAGPFAGARLRVLDENGRRTGKATADPSGAFKVKIPAGQIFHLVIEGEGHVPAAFTGVSGLDERFVVEEGVLHGFTEAEWGTWADAFAGCPGVGEGGAVLGEPRVIELVDEDGSHPGVAAAVAELWNPRTDEVTPACYLDAETGAWSEGAAATGEAGVFGIFGIPEGVYVLSVGFEAFPDTWTWEDTWIYVPDQGVAPRFPAWVSFPLR